MVDFEVNRVDGFEVICMIDFEVNRADGFEVIRTVDFEVNRPDDFEVIPTVWLRSQKLLLWGNHWHLNNKRNSVNKKN